MATPRPTCVRRAGAGRDAAGAARGRGDVSVRRDGKHPLRLDPPLNASERLPRFGRSAPPAGRRITTQAVQELHFGECSPRIKAGTGESEARIAAIRELQEFWTLHAEAVANIKAGRSAVFPLGSYRWPRVFAFSTAT